MCYYKNNEIFNIRYQNILLGVIYITNKKENPYYSIRPFDIDKKRFEENILGHLIEDLPYVTKKTTLPKSAARHLESKFKSIFSKEITSSDLISKKTPEELKSIYEDVKYLGYHYLIQDIYTSPTKFLQDDFDEKIRKKYLFTYEIQILLGLLLLVEHQFSYLNNYGETKTKTRKNHDVYDDFLVNSLLFLEHKNKSMPIGYKYIGLGHIVYTPSFQATHSLLKINTMYDNLKLAIDSFYPSNKKIHKANILDSINLNTTSTFFNVFCSINPFKSGAFDKDTSENYNVYEALDNCSPDNLLTIEQLMINHISHEVSHGHIAVKSHSDCHEKDFKYFQKEIHLPKDLVQKRKYNFYKELSITTSIEELNEHVVVNLNVVAQKKQEVSFLLSNEIPNKENDLSTSTYNQQQMSSLPSDMKLLKELISENLLLYGENTSYNERYSSPKTNEKSINLIKEIIFELEEKAVEHTEYIKEVYGKKHPYEVEEFLQSILDYRQDNSESSTKEIALAHKNKLIELRKQDIDQLTNKISAYTEELKILSSMETNESIEKFEKDSSHFTNEQLNYYFDEKK